MLCERYEEEDGGGEGRERGVVVWRRGGGVTTPRAWWLVVAWVVAGTRCRMRMGRFVLTRPPAYGGMDCNRTRVANVLSLTTYVS